jgi:hypothetical protein
MNDRRLDDLLEAWLEAGPTAAPARVAEAARLEARSSRQLSKAESWAIRRMPAMNTLMRFAVAAAAVALLAVIGGPLLVALNRGAPLGVGHQPADASRSPVPTHSGPCQFRSIPPPPGGPEPFLAIGPHSLNVQCVELSFRIPARGWETFGGTYISKSAFGPQGAEAVMLWTGIPDGPEADVCLPLDGVSGASASGVVEAVATLPGMEVLRGPREVAVGGRAAHTVAVIVREDRGCDPGYLFTWDWFPGGAFWSDTLVGDTIQVWTVDIDGRLLVVEAITHPNAGDAVSAQIQQIVDSMQFE